MTARAPKYEDPVLAALDRAPLGGPLAAEQQAEVDQALADLASGRTRLVSSDEVARTIADMRRQQGG